jgi:hypothetical protein
MFPATVASKAGRLLPTFSRGMEISTSARR